MTTNFSMFRCKHFSSYFFKDSVLYNLVCPICAILGMNKYNIICKSGKNIFTCDAIVNLTELSLCLVTMMDTHIWGGFCDTFFYTSPRLPKPRQGSV